LKCRARKDPAFSCDVELTRQLFQSQRNEIAALREAAMARA
jgi:type III secretory pathway lipoprotein EscJ